MHCSTVGIRFQLPGTMSWLYFTILAVTLSVPRTLTTLLRDTRCESEGPIWPYVCPFCETFLGPGPWLQPPISATEGNGAELGLWSYDQERKRENWKRFHPFYWQRVKENSLKLSSGEGQSSLLGSFMLKVYLSLPTDNSGNLNYGSHTHIIQGKVMGTP